MKSNGRRRAFGAGGRGVVVAAVAAGTAAGGCAIDRNDRPTIGGELLLPALEPAPELPAADAGPWRRASGPIDAPPLTFERDNWDAVTFVVPVDGTAHWPTFTGPLRVTDPESRRKEGLYPTLLSALETRQMDLGDSAWEVTAAPFVALGEIVLIPVRAFTAPAWGEVQTPGSPPLRLYKRSDGERWYSGTGSPFVTTTVEPEDVQDPGSGLETIEPGPREEELPDDAPDNRAGGESRNGAPLVPEPTPERGLPSRRGER